MKHILARQAAQRERWLAAQLLLAVILIGGAVVLAASVNGKKLQEAREKALDAAKHSAYTKAYAEQQRSKYPLAVAASFQPDPAEDEDAYAEARRAAADVRKDMCIGAMILGEAGSEPLIGKYMAGYVGHMRAVDGWFGSHNPCVQVCRRGKGTHREFDGTKHFCAQVDAAFKKGGRLPTVPEEYISMARDIRTGAFQPSEECRKVRYFANFAQSSPGGIKDFQKNTKIRCIFGEHLFAEDRPKVGKALAEAKPRKHHYKRARPTLEAAAPAAAPRQHKKLAAR